MQMDVSSWKMTVIWCSHVKNLQNNLDTGESAMKGHETDAAAMLGMNDAAQLEHDQWRSKTID